MDKKCHKLKFETIIDKPEKVNPDFAKVKIHILYSGLNRNNSYISKETIEKYLIPTIYNIPVIGEWVEEDKDFGTHGGKLELSDKGIKYIETTKPYGVVPSDTELTWETIREKDGITEHEYLTCTAYLWYGRYPEIEKVLDKGANQSMEIMVDEGEWDDEEGFYNIEKAHFSALCILGSDVEPCFESADVQSYSLNKEEFKKEFTLLLHEVKQLANLESEVEGNMDKNESLKKDNATLTDDKKESMKKDENKEDIKIKEKYEKVKSDLEKLQNKINKLEKENKELKEFKEEKLAEERKANEEKLFNSYEELEGNEDFESLKENAKDYTLEELEKEIALVYVKSIKTKKNNFSLQEDKHEDKKEDIIKLDFEEDKKEKNESPYGDLFKKYNKK